jgi:hypothetical protein
MRCRRGGVERVEEKEGGWWVEFDRHIMDEPI